MRDAAVKLVEVRVAPDDAGVAASRSAAATAGIQGQVRCRFRVELVRIGELTALEGNMRTYIYQCAKRTPAWNGVYTGTLRAVNSFARS